MRPSLVAHFAALPTLSHPLHSTLFNRLSSQKSLRSIRRLKTLGLLSTFILTLASAFAATPGPIPPDQPAMKTLISHIPPLVHLAKKVGPLNPQQQLSILIQFQQTHSSDIAQLIQDQQNPHSPNYGKHLTSEQFNQQFSQSKSAIQEQASKLTAAGFLVDKVNPQGIRARASVKQIESFFHTQLWVFQRPDAKTTFYAPIEELQVSADSIIATVIGLDTAAQIHRASPPSP